MRVELNIKNEQVAHQILWMLEHFKNELDIKIEDETEYLMSNPNNAKHLLESIEEIKKGKVIIKDFNELNLE